MTQLGTFELSETGSPLPSSNVLGISKMFHCVEHCGEQIQLSKLNKSEIIEMLGPYCMLK